MCQHEVGMGQRQGLVKALVAHATDEALDEAVLHELARGDVMPLDLPHPVTSTE